MIITIPRHPDDAAIPDSTVNLLLPSGCVVTIQAPMFSKTMGMLSDVLVLCKDAIVEKKVSDDFQI